MHYVYELAGKSILSFELNCKSDEVFLNYEILKIYLLNFGMNFKNAQHRAFMATLLVLLSNGFKLLNK